MGKEKGRETMIVYRSFFESLKGCEKEVQADVWNAIFEMGFNQKEVELDGLSKTLWLLIKPQIEANLKRFLNGSKPKQKQNVSETEAKTKQERSESEANNNNNKNNNNITRTPSKNKQPFLEEVISYFNENNYTTESATKAFNYYHPEWKDSQGKRVLNWKQKMRGVWFKDENLIKGDEDLTLDQQLYRNVMAQINNR
jgi:hypothetical protein